MSDNLNSVYLVVIRDCKYYILIHCPFLLYESLILSNTVIPFPLSLVFYHSLFLQIIYGLFSSYQLISEKLSFAMTPAFIRPHCFCVIVFIHTQQLQFYDSRVLTKPSNFFIPFHKDFEAADCLLVQLYCITIYSHEML